MHHNTNNNVSYVASCMSINGKGKYLFSICSWLCVFILLFYWTRCYWGYCFETLATEDPRRDGGEGIHHIDANVEYCAVIKTKLGAHRILMGAEMDCCDSTDDGRRFYVELKTSREVWCVFLCKFIICALNFCVFMKLWSGFLFSYLYLAHDYWLTVGISYRRKIREREITQILGMLAFHLS